MPSYHWYVVQAKPGQTERAYRELENQGFEVFLPEIGVEKIRRGKRTQILEPMFPGYLFIYLSEVTSNWRPIRSTRGVARLIVFGDTPARVPHAVIDAIRDHLRAPVRDVSAYKPRQPVRITEGPFVGLEALFEQYDGEQRAFLLLDMLGRWQKLSIDLNAIEPS